MLVYETDGRWYAQAQGGRINRDIVPAEVRGPYTERPTPVARWQDEEGTEYGTGRTRFTLFAAGGVNAFTLTEYDWWPASGYSAQINHEAFIEPIDPPELGECYRWSGDGWLVAVHPQEV